VLKTDYKAFDNEVPLPYIKCSEHFPLSSRNLHQSYIAPDTLFDLDRMFLFVCLTWL